MKVTKRYGEDFHSHGGALTLDSGEVSDVASASALACFEENQ